MSIYSINVDIYFPISNVYLLNESNGWFDLCYAGYVGFIYQQIKRRLLITSNKLFRSTLKYWKYPKWFNTVLQWCLRYGIPIDKTLPSRFPRLDKQLCWFPALWLCLKTYPTRISLRQRGHHSPLVDHINLPPWVGKLHLDTSFEFTFHSGKRSSISYLFKFTWASCWNQAVLSLIFRYHWNVYYIDYLLTVNFV